MSPVNSPLTPGPDDRVVDLSPAPGLAEDNKPVAAEAAGDRSGRRTVIAPMPRRARIGQGETRTSTLSPRRNHHYHPPAWAVAWRLLAWLSRLVGFFLGNLVARLRGGGGVEYRARRLRLMLQSMGPTAIKLGQQLSIRADILSFEYCDELSKMLDSVPPFEFEDALRTIERAVGRPTGEVFARLDPQPIGSASLACVYQAQLVTGEKVAVKVKRPGIGRQIATDVKAICWICQLSEVLGVVRGGLTRNFQLELTRMLTEELDFILEGRYTEIFRRDAKRHKHVSAPRVFHHLSDFDVLVTEFVSGVFLSEVLCAVESRDRRDLDQLKARGFRPELISHRMLQIFYWECFESHFFHADPHPANIIIRPDNTIVMIDFGSCGSVSSRMRRRMLSFDRYMVKHDLDGMVQTTISMLEPLPLFDVASFSSDIMNVYRECFIAHQSRHAPWYDKSSGGMWMKVIMLSQRYQLPMTLDTVRILRANFLYDSIVYRLHPKLDPLAVFMEYAAQWDAKNRQRGLRAIRARLTGPLPSDFTRQQEFASFMENAFDRIQCTLDRPSYSFELGIGKIAYVFTAAVRASMMVFATLLVMSLVRVVTGVALRSQEPTVGEVFEAIGESLTNRYFLSGVTFYVLIVMRKILFKLQEVDVK